MNNQKSLLLFFGLLFVMVFSACSDESLYDDSIIGDGEAVISATIDFHPLITTNNTTSSRGTEGDALAAIDDFTLFIYNGDGKIFDIVNDDELTDLKVSQKDAAEGGYNTDMPNDAGGKPVQAEANTARATFTLKNIPFGRYYIYCVANMGRFVDNDANRAKFLRPTALREIMLEWNQTDVSANKQMFGYFTTDGNDTNVSAGFEAPLIPINSSRTHLHAWIKRAASKVTVVFDGSGLHEDIWIFVKSVTIKDIPKYCRLGIENRVGDADSLIANGETIYYTKDGATAPGSVPSTGTMDWLQVSSGSGKKGAVTVVEGDTVCHSEYDQALYFFENLQGDYKDSSNKEYYNKQPDWKNVGWVPQPGQYDYKDNVKFGTYIEVDAYYISTNPDQVSQGEIKYRFMLGQNVTYNYNALRNHHYKVTLGFKGYANQPDWHVDYVQEGETFYNDPTYYVSYSYNTKSIFPVRILGDVKSFDVEIVENNWAPYDPTQPDSVPPATVGSGNIAFKWYREAYLSGVATTSMNANTYNNGTYNYGLQKPRKRNGTADTTYTDAAAPKKVTPIWAGFLALNVTGNVPEDIPQELFPTSDGYHYSSLSDRKAFKNYFYDNKQNVRSFSAQDLSFSDWTPGEVRTKVVGTGNNKCEIVKAADGSVSVKLPLWTRPKILLGISGFSGNNPYDTYKRKAVVKLTTVFESGKKVVKYTPVYQVQREVNPMGVWRAWDDNSSFNVTLVRREGAAETIFHPHESQGAWRAYVKTWRPGSEGFIELEGGIGKDVDGAIIGNTDTPVNFRINFKGKGDQSRSHCAIVQIEYNGFTCQHSIFVRQGYEPLALNGSTRWSCYSLFKCGGVVGSGSSTTPYQTQWNSSKKNYISAELTSSPIAFGTLFRRGNYNGVLDENSSRTGLGPNENPGRNTTFKMSDGNNLTWEKIDGLAYINGYSGSTTFGASSVNTTFTWGRFEVEKNGVKRHYRVPSYEDFEALHDCEYKVGVIYGSDATTTALTTEDAFGFVDYNNTGVGSRGMRGVLVYNPQNAHQLFFPVGSTGIGRRTITASSKTSYNNHGVLRYGGVANVLDGQTNALRPIPYNLPASPGAIYWIEKIKTANGSSFLSWDMNYFDLNFNAYDHATSFSPNGDALPIRLVLDE